MVFIEWGGENACSLRAGWVSSRTLFGLSLAMNLASFVGGLVAFHL